jgi:hypothetical protein
VRDEGKKKGSISNIAQKKLACKYFIPGAAAQVAAARENLNFGRLG